MPLSLIMSDGQPRRAINRHRAAKNASLVKSETNSRWIALTVRNMKTYSYVCFEYSWFADISHLKLYSSGIINSHSIEDVDLCHSFRLAVDQSAGIEVWLSHTV